MSQFKAGDIVIALVDYPQTDDRPPLIKGETYVVERIKDDHWIYLSSTPEGYGLGPKNFCLSEAGTSRHHGVAIWTSDELWDVPMERA